MLEAFALWNGSDLPGGKLSLRRGSIPLGTSQLGTCLQKEERKQNPGPGHSSPSLFLRLSGVPFHVHPHCSPCLEGINAPKGQGAVARAACDGTQQN